MLSEKGSILFLSDPGKSLETQRRRSIMPFPVGRNDTKHRVTETQSFVFLSTAHRVYGPFVCGESADPVVSLVIFLQTVTGLCVSVFNINYTLCRAELRISTLPALHVLTFRTSGSFQLRTFASFQPRTIGNLEEVELWVTAGGSPKGNTCGLSHPLFLTSTF